MKKYRCLTCATGIVLVDNEIVEVIDEKECVKGYCSDCKQVYLKYKT